MRKILSALLIMSLNAYAVPPVSVDSEVSPVGNYVQNTKLPNEQATQLSSRNTRIETGNTSLLKNPNFEHMTAGFGWTTANATVTANTAAPFEGKKSLSLSLTGALSFSQFSTINAPRKLGVQMVASMYIKSDDVSDLQLCSLKNNLEDKCTVVGGYTQGSGWRKLTVSFAGDATSNGVKLKSTDTTGIVLVDQAFVGVGSPIVDFMPDQDFSAQISSTAVVSMSTPSDSNWIQSVGVTTISYFTVNFKPGHFLAAPTCMVSIVTSGSYWPMISIQATTSSIQVYTGNAGGASPQAFNLICSRTTSDYKSSSAYVASGSMANNLIYTATITTTSGSVSGTNVSNWITCTAANPTVCTFASGIFTAAPTCTTGNNINGGATVPKLSLMTSTGFTMETYLTSTLGATGSQSVPVTCIKTGNDFLNSYNPVIVGSFQGVPTVPGISSERVESFVLSFGATASTDCTTGTCAYVDVLGTNPGFSVSVSGTTYTMTTPRAYTKLKCGINGVDSGVGLVTGFINSAAGTSHSFQLSSGAGSSVTAYATMNCQASY